MLSGKTQTTQKKNETSNHAAYICKKLKRTDRAVVQIT